VNQSLSQQAGNRTIFVARFFLSVVVEANMLMRREQTIETDREVFVALKPKSVEWYVRTEDEKRERELK
jgi:hypothetical protein